MRRPITQRLHRRPVITACPAKGADDLYDTRVPSSTRSYSPVVIQEGGRRLVVHQGLPQRNIDWRITASLGATGMVCVILAINGITAWWSDYQINQKYGNPRTYQVDAVVGHSDSDRHPSHFIFENLSGHVLIIELSGGDPAHSHIYVGPTLLGDGANTTPVMGEFDDETGRGTRDMVIHVQNQRIVFLNDGTQFKEQRP